MSGEVLRRVMDDEASDRDNLILVIGFMCGLAARMEAAQKLKGSTQQEAWASIQHDVEWIIKTQLARLPEITSPFAQRWR